MKLSAVIFDLDGTILDNEDEYGLAFKKVLEDLGAKDVPDYPQVGGIGVNENWPGLLTKYNVKTTKSIELLGHLTQEAYLKLLERVTLKDGFEDYSLSLKDDGLKIALATSNERWIVEKVFDKLDLNNYFDVVTTGEEVRFKKPEPDLFLTTAEKLGVGPKECLVIEDAPSGVEAAHRTGMKVYALARNKAQVVKLKDADKIFFRYNELQSK